MLELAAAWERIAAACAPLAPERVELAAALGRVPAEPGRSAVDLPPFDRSAMDGWAVRAADTGEGAELSLSGAVAAGESPADPLPPGTAVAVTTGAALPPGADAVLQAELGELRDGRVVCAQGIARGRHVRFRGEDVRAGDVLAPAGEPLNIQRLSALASAGVGAVAAHRRPRVAILATGSELLPLGAPPQPGRIHESNRVVVAGLAQRAGARVIASDTVPDDADLTRAAIAGALGQADVVVITGGVSVGTHDHVKGALADNDVEEVFWRVRLRPGKPLWFGRRGETLVFGLPGNPLSTIACFLAFVEPALRRLLGERDARIRTRPVRLATAAEASDGRTTFLSATFALAADGVLEATPLPEQGSHLTGALARADGFVVVPHDAGALSPGDPATGIELT